MLLGARTMQACLDSQEPHRRPAMAVVGTVVIGTVKGDLHDIGKNLVAMMLQGAGFEVVDLGIDVDAEKFVAASWSTSPPSSA